MNFVLEKAQIRAISELKTRKYSLLHGDMGTGKTLICLTLHKELNKNNTVIIVPAYLLSNWEQEINKFYPEIKYSIFKNSKDIKYVPGTKLYLISYGILKNSEKLFEWANLVIADEAHFLKNIKASRTNILHKLIFENSIERLVLSTGTPITNRVWEFYSLLALCEYDPQKGDSAFLKKFPSYIDFADYFSYRKDFMVKQGKYLRNVTQWSGIKNTEELKTWLKRVRVRIKLEEVMKGNLPEVIENDIEFETIDNPELDAAFEKFILEGGDSISSEIKAKAALEKVPLTISYVKDLISSGITKVLIYTDHVESAKAIAKSFDIACITGETDIIWRKRLGNSFQEGDSPILIATLGSFSTGVTLTSCHHTVFNDLCWTPGLLDQAKARTRRKGQLKQCFYHYIVKFSQDLKIRKTLQSKNETISKTEE